MKMKRWMSAALCAAMLLTAAVAPAAAAAKEEDCLECPINVVYALGSMGVSGDLTSEKVEVGASPANMPQVVPLTNREFLGWSLTDPLTLAEGEEITLIDPATVVAEAETDLTFYAIYEEADTPVKHERYMKGYPDGNFGPADNITRGEVAAIIARACLEGFREDENYGTGGYLDMDGSHWATSAIAYCTMAGVYEGYDDGNFYPDKPITRQEFSLVFARLVGLQNGRVSDLPFTDAGDISFWAVDGIYTAYSLGWIEGYLDNTFKPLNNIARSEAAKIVNRYLNRGVDAAGVADVMDQVKQWPDVLPTYWAYYEILEATNDHDFIYVDGVQPPEEWSKAYLDETSWGS